MRDGAVSYLSAGTVRSQAFNVISLLPARSNNSPEATVKWELRCFRPAYVFNPSHQWVAFENRVLIGVDLCARYGLIALTPTWDAGSDLSV